MEGTPNVAGMVADPDFQGLAPADKRAALAKVTGDQSFSSLNDGETMQFVSRFNKAPAQVTANAPQAGPLLQAQGLGDKTAALGGDAQAQQQRQAQANQMMTSAAGANERGQTQAQRTARQGMAKNIAISGANALPDAGMVVGGALGTPADVATGPGGTFGGAALGGAAGEAAKKGLLSMMGQNQPAPFSAQNMQDIGMAGAQGATAEMGGQIIGKGVEAVSPAISRGLQKFMGESQERIANLKALPEIEESIRQRIVQTEAASRTSFKAAYDKMGIDAASVNVAESKNLANNAAEELSKFTGVPRSLSKVGDIPAPSQNLLTSDDPATILQQLHDWDQVPFRDAQRFRTGIEQYISKSHPPAQVYNALKQVSGALGDGLEKTAMREGVLDQFQAANQMFKDHAGDFWNKQAPLKPFVQTPANATGATLNRFTQTATQSRALDALDRRGVLVQDLRGLLGKGSQALKADIKDAATLRNIGREPLDVKARAPVRAAVIKRGGEAIGLGGAGMFTDYLARKLAGKH